MISRFFAFVGRVLYWMWITIQAAISVAIVALVANYTHSLGWTSAAALVLLLLWRKWQTARREHLAWLAKYNSPDYVPVLSGDSNYIPEDPTPVRVSKPRTQTPNTQHVRTQYVVAEVWISGFAQRVPWSNMQQAIDSARSRKSQTKNTVVVIQNVNGQDSGVIFSI